MTRPLIYTVLPRPPNPSRDGLAIRNYHLLASLAREFRVRSFVLVPPHLESEPASYPNGVKVETVRQSPRGLRKLAAVAGTLVAGAYPRRLYASPALERSIREAAGRERPHWVVAQSYHVAPAAAAAGFPLWVDFHNVDSQIWRRLGETHDAPVARLFARLQAPRVEAFERDVVKAAEGISCVSELDARALAALGPRAAPLVVPNGVDLSRYQPRQGALAEDLVAFVGDLTWPPNILGIRWFQREVWPEVKRRRPRARAEILGRGGERVAGEGSADFVFLGAAEDTRPLWSRAAVAVVPLFSGGGTRLKILEAAACGVPVVSTSVGAEGLSFPAEEILVSDDAIGFAEAVCRLLERPEEATRQASAARSRVERTYDWSAIGARFAQELSRRLEPAA